MTGPDAEAFSRSLESACVDVLPDIIPAPQDLPEQWSRTPRRILAILCLRAMGWTQNEIAGALKVTQGAVSMAMQRWDPERIFVLSPAQLESMSLARWRAKESQALAAMTQDKLEASSAAQLAMIAGVSRDKINRTATIHQAPDADPASALSAFGPPICSVLDGATVPEKSSTRATPTVSTP